MAAKKRGRVPSKADVRKAKEKTPPPKSAARKGGVSKAAVGIKKPGATTAAARRAGESVHEWSEKHKHAPGKAGRRARMALMFEGKRGGRKKSRAKG